MKNFVQCGDVIEYSNAGSAIASGDVVVIGSVCGIAVTDIATDDSGNVQIVGVVEVKKDSPLAISQGDELFWNTTDKEATKTATDKPLGIAFEDAGSSDTTVKVKLYGNGNAIATAANVAQITTANGSDATTTQALANATKTSVNAILTALKNAGIMVAD